MQESIDHVSSTRFEAVCADLRARLRTVCCHCPPDEFDGLVERMARLHLKYDLASPTRGSAAA